MNTAMRGVRREIADTADALLQKILLSNPAPSSLQTKRLFGDIKSRLWGCDFHLVDGDLVDKLEPGARYVPPEDAPELLRTIWPLDIGFMGFNQHDQFYLDRVSTVFPSDVRGLARTVPSKILHFATAVERAQGEFTFDADLLGFLGGKWVTILDATGRGVTRTHMDDVTQKQYHDKFALSHSFALTQRYSWHVAFGYSDTAPRLLLPTNPKGLLKLFKDRELSPGKYRRDPLRHWVSEFYRQSARDPEEVVYVRNHLRANKEFIWNGLACELLVSDYDLEKNELFRSEAALWRSRRGHNRVKLRRNT